MKIQYFEDTDTLYIIFSNNLPIETKDLASSARSPTLYFPKKR
ncbi:MAG: DUF2283 domain-containing protein [Crocosphaera sp.]